MGASKGPSKRSKSSSKSSNASSASANRRRQVPRKGSKTKNAAVQLGIATEYHSKLAPDVVRSSFILAEPKMQSLQKFVRIAGQEPEEPAAFEDDESILESFGDDRSPDASPGSFWDEPTPRFDLSPASRRTSKESRRNSASSRRMSAFTQKTAGSRRTSATSTARRQSTETDASVPSRFGFNKQSTEEFSTKLARPASASAILQARARLEMLEDEQSRSTMVQRVNERVRELVEEAKQPFPFSKRDIEAPPAPEKDTSLRSYFSPGHAELSALEARRDKARFYDKKPVHQYYLNRAGHSLQKLLVDFDLSKHSGGEAQMHRARCDHAERILGWYENHVAPCEVKAREAPRTTVPWLFLKEDEKPPPGSMRPRSALSRVRAIHAGYSAPFGPYGDDEQWRSRLPRRPASAPLIRAATAGNLN